MSPQPSPIRATTAEAFETARTLLRAARYGALAVEDPITKTPNISRIALATDASGRLITLISDLSHHTKALHNNPACALLVGEPGPKGDPLTHPRLSLQATAELVSPDQKQALRSTYLDQNPKAQLYIDFADFNFVRFALTGAALNAGFGKAYVFEGADLAALGSVEYHR